MVSRSGCAINWLDVTGDGPGTVLMTSVGPEADPCAGKGLVDGLGTEVVATDPRTGAPDVVVDAGEETTSEDADGF